MAKYELTLPRMGESVEEATIINWLKNEGDLIQVDDLVVEIATDKVDSEVPSDVKGVLLKKLCLVNEVVRVGEPLAIIEIESDIEQSGDIKDQIETETKKSSQLIDSAQKETIDLISKAKDLIDPKSSRQSKLILSPLVRSISEKEGVSEDELNSINGSGKDGRITKNDLIQYIDERSSNETTPNQFEENNFNFSESDKIYEMSRMERLVSDHMIHSKNESAHVQSFIEADITNIWDWKKKYKISFKILRVKLTFTPVFIMLVAKALKKYPVLNGSLSGYNLKLKRNINIGMATALPDGNLIVPVIKNADQLSLLGLVKKVNDLAKRSRNSQLAPEEVKDGTYTVSNVGVFDTLMGTPIINQPQLGVLAFGSIRKEPSVIETNKGDFVGIRKKIILSHSYDHRIINGATGGMFIKTIKELIEKWDVNQEV